MKVAFTDAARADLDQLLAYTRRHYPSVVPALEQRIRDVIARVARWPKSARGVQGRPGVRVVPLLRYPYKIFYRMTDEDRDPSHSPQLARLLTRMHGPR
jgi:plasmid stabilization system protein ParE